jgi:DNA invertase Pin-like site-specific DNA recombinase
MLQKVELFQPVSVNTLLKDMRRKITNETWEQIKTGYAAGIGLREMARKMNISVGTVLTFL